MSLDRSDELHRKLAAILLVTIALVTVVFGCILVYKRIFDPLRPTSNFTLQGEDEAQAARMAMLKKQDTDHDTVSDYDELYIYSTSPYLEDSDSDGLLDGVEIAGNEDPNCPRGKVCRVTAQNQPADTGTSGQGTATGAAGGNAGTAGDATTGASPDAAASGAQTQYDAIAEAFGDPTKLTEAQVRAKVDAMTSAELHDFLRKMNVPDSAIAKNTDETLKKLLADTLVEIAGAGATR